MHPLDRLRRRHASQEFGGKLRQHRARQDVVDIASSTIDFLAAFDDAGDDLRVVGERRPIMLFDAAANAPQLELDDATNERHNPYHI